MQSEVIDIAVQAGKLALKGAKGLNKGLVKSKGHLDLVTQVDKDVETFLTGRISTLFPMDGLLGEEGAVQVSKSGRTWIVDPIDGTFNFVRGGEDWAVSIGLIEAGEPVFGVIYVPRRDDLYVGGKGIPSTLNGERLAHAADVNKSQISIGVGFHPQTQIETRTQILSVLWNDVGVTIRSCGSATISLMQVARGETDGYIGVGESSWDVAAACAILKPLGFETTIDWKRQSLTDKLQIAVGSTEVLATLTGLDIREDPLVAKQGTVDGMDAPSRRHCNFPS